MIKPGALILAAAMAAVAAGTYFGLGLLPPGTIPSPIGRATPAQPQKPADSTVSENTAAPQAAPDAAPPAPVAADPHAAPTEQELAEEPPPKPAATQVAQAAPAPATPAPTPAPEAKPEPAAAPPPDAKAESKPEQKAAAPAPAAKAQEEKPVAARGEKSRPGNAKPAAAAADTAAAEATPTESPAPATPAKTQADSDAIQQWWPDPDKLPANQMKLRYAGDVQGEASIALLFDSVPNLDSVRLHAHVRDASGSDIGGTWETGRNPQLVVYRGLKEGRYTVILDKELADAHGFALGQTLQGAVYITSK